MRFPMITALKFCTCAMVCVLMGCPAVFAQVAGTNVNMVSGTKWPTGDPFLQRQNEPSMAVSTRNPMHILAGANDYRTVDLELALTDGKETADSWLGLFKSFDGGLTWTSTLLPGCPQDVPQCIDNNGTGNPALQHNYEAASDPVVRAGTNGMFYYVGLAFTRSPQGALGSSSSIFVARYVDLNNNEKIDPITYIDTHPIATGSNGQFLDKPALAVDIPRSGANACSFTASEPTASGGMLPVHQSFPAGNVYVAYTDFLAATKDNSTPTHLMFARSTDCGVTWSTPVQINTGTTTSQGSTIAVNPWNGNVYVAWRQFASAGVPDAIMIAQSSNAGKSFGAPVRISTFQPFDQGTTGTSFRTNAYPSLTTDFFGFVYVAFSARGLGPGGDARVVAAGSIDGTHWTPAIMVDNPPQNAQTNPSGRGHQIMPSIAFANGRLTLLYYDLRFDHYENIYTPNPASPGTYTPTLKPEGELAPPTPTPAKVFTQYVDDAGLEMRRHTIDLRVLELGIFPTVTLGPSVSVTQYEFGCCIPLGSDIQQFKFNVPNLPLFGQGSVPFLGDYIEVVPSPMFVPHGSGWRYNFMPSVNPLFHATWTDNRDVIPPPDGNWKNYTPPVAQSTPSLYQPGQNVSCVPGQGREGMRNQNIYTAQITGGLVVGAPGNAKPLGTTTFNGQIVPFQRAFAVEAQNVTSQQIFVRFTIANQPTGGSASFLQFSPLTTLDITIPGFSSVSRSVFVTSTDPKASVTVNVVQISAIGGSGVSNGLSSSAVLNPDITNPDITNPDITNPDITNLEVTNPDITNPDITNPDITNPDITNPDITNPDITNPDITNPGAPNPDITNPDITNPDITNPDITNPDITNGSIQDVVYPMTNDGNTTSTYTVKVATFNPPPGTILFQLVLNKLYLTPEASNCQLGTKTHWVTVANITKPTLFAANDPNLGNPDITNSAPSEASVTLAPGEKAYITVRVINPNRAVLFNPLTSITPVTIPQAVNTQTVLSNPGNTTLTPPIVFPPPNILTTSLPPTDLNSQGYSVQLLSSGGKSGTDTWSISSGFLPIGMNLSPAGLISGQPTQVGSFPVTVRVTDSASNFGSANLTLVVNAPFLISSEAPMPDGIVGQPYSALPWVTIGGTPPTSWSATGLPPGLTIDPTSGRVSGIPTTANPTGFGSIFTNTDSATPPVFLTAPKPIRVAAPLVITTSSLPNGTVGAPYLATPQASGGIGSYAWSVTGLSLGLVLDSQTGMSTGTISGTPNTSGTLTVTFTVRDSGNPSQSAMQTFNIVVANPVVVFSGQIGDPTGDACNTCVTNPPAPDLVFGSATVYNNGAVQLSVRFAPGTFNPQTTEAEFLLDTDQNPATGSPGVDSVGSDSALMGSDYLVVLDSGFNNNQATIYKAIGGLNQFAVLGTAPVTVSANGMDVTFPLSTLVNTASGNTSGPATSGPWNFKVTDDSSIGQNQFTGALDYMPNLGLVPGTTAAPAACAMFPTGFVPFTTIYSVARDSAGDTFIVGGFASGAFSELQYIPLPSAGNQQFCNPVMLETNYIVPTYVPTAAERGGDFSAYPGLTLIDPQTNQPFPSNMIPINRLSLIFAWRIPQHSSTLPQYACSLEPTLHSIEGTVTTSIQFTNNTAGPVNVLWINYQGTRVFYRGGNFPQLGAGQSYVQGTFITHPWIITDATGACLGIWLPTESPDTAVIAGPVAISSVNLSSTTLSIEGANVPYTAILSNGTGTTVSSVFVQAYIDQGAASRAAGGSVVTCVSTLGDLPPGSCNFNFSVLASNKTAGTGTLVPGSATARFELRNANTLFSVFTVAVTLQ